MALPQVFLPRSVFLPRNEEVGGYIFCCSDYSLPEFLRRQIFGLPFQFHDSVQKITPGTPLFLYNYGTECLHGIFEATSFGGFNIDPYAWPIINYLGCSWYPAQVRIRWRRECHPLTLEMSRSVMQILTVGEFPEDKFRVELRGSEAQRIMDLFDANEARIRSQR